MKNFEWERLGDINAGRENLGENMPVVIYRLLQFTLKDTIAEKYGEDIAEEILRTSGYVAGSAFAQNSLKKSDSFSEFIEDLQMQLKNLKIGILRVEKADLEKLNFVLTVSEDLDCSGLPVTGDTVCAYDEGFIAAIFDCFTGVKFNVSEIDCWATGARTCRFVAKPV